MTHPALDDDFYRAQPTFADFAGVADEAAYAPVPETWLVAIADIVKSTAAIAEGRYKAVNMIGVSVISALLNRIGRDRLPFVFGGDGAIVLVPASGRAAAAEALSGVARIASEAAGLTLRVALIPVADLRRAGTDIRLRKFELSPGNHLAMIRGDGLMLAEHWLKDEVLGAPYRITDPDPAMPDLTGFTCRWEPLLARHGRIVSLMVRPTAAAGPDGLMHLMQGLRQHADVDARTMEMAEAPVQEETLRMKTVPTGLDQELQLVSHGKVPPFQRAKALIQVALIRFIRWTGVPFGPLKPARYMREMQLNTDFRKFDDTLRLVLDVSDAQAGALKAFLESGFEAGRLVYGLTESREALMTCYVANFGAGQHVHFVDGADGGLALASRDFKQRQAALERGLPFDAAAKPA